MTQSGRIFGRRTLLAALAATVAAVAGAFLTPASASFPQSAAVSGRQPAPATGSAADYRGILGVL
jgi:hypothetical protein